MGEIQRKKNCFPVMRKLFVLNYHKSTDSTHIDFNDPRIPFVALCAPVDVAIES